MNPGDNYQQQQAPVLVPPQGQVQPPNALGYQFSAEELRVLRICNSESFWQRSLPIGTALGVSTYLACQRGIIGTSARFGSGPKVALACVLGYFFGKFSYQQKCAEKMMALPNSKLGEALRRRKKGEFFEGSGLSLAPFGSTTDVYTDENLKDIEPNKSAGSSLDLDIDRPFNSGLDDTYRPSLDTPDRSFSDNLPSEPPKSSTTYDDLRRQNRFDYEKKMLNPYYKPITEGDAAPIQRAQPSPFDDQPVQQTGPRNKYGDAWVK